MSRLEQKRCYLLLGLAICTVLGHAIPAVGEDHRSAAQMAAWIDQSLRATWRAASISPAPRSNDSQFLRRIHLDMTGCTPTVAATREFLTSTDPLKRGALIERLLTSPRYANHMANTWRNILLPDGFEPTQLQNAIGLHDWLRMQFADNLRYDGLVSELLTTTGSLQHGPGLFYTSLELKPEKLAASTSRIFLGLQIECAQCHDHPYDDWSQEDFWSFAAFFAQLRNETLRGRREQQLTDRLRGEVTLPETQQVIRPKYPGGQPADPEEGGTRRMQLAIWMASRDNPFLARAAVNRSWAHLFGRGLVEPVDDVGPHNPASHPEILAELTKYFSHDQFDLKNLWRALLLTEAYQLSSETTEMASPVAPEAFASMAVKPLSAEQLYDSLIRTLSTQSDEMAASGTPRLRDAQRQLFLAKMNVAAKNPTDYAWGATQALQLMNGPLINLATDPDQGNLLLALEAPFLNDEERVEILYLATVSRYPNPDQRKRCRDVLASGTDRSARQKSLSDILWALLNSAEFAFVR